MRKNSYFPVLVSIAVWIVFFGICSGATLENRYLLVNMDDETGRFFISTVEGRPDVIGDEKKNLLFYDVPPSSFSVVYLDNDAVIYGDNMGKFIQRPLVFKNSMRSMWIYSDVIVTESIMFLKRKSSNIEDGVLISYKIENNTKKKIKAGIMVVLDTYLGEWDEDHFICSSGKIKGEKVFLKKELPSYWISKGSKKYPNTCFKGYVENNLTEPPDKLIFANYKYIRENLIFRPSGRRDFNYLPFSKNDSVVAFYFQPTVLEQGEIREYGVVVGLCGEGTFTTGKRILEEVKVEKLPPAIEKKLEEEKLRKTHEKKELEKVVRGGISLEEIDGYLKQIEAYQKKLSDIDSVLEKLNEYIDNKETPVDEDTLKNLKKYLEEIAE